MHMRGTPDTLSKIQFFRDNFGTISTLRFITTGFPHPEGNARELGRVENMKIPVQPQKMGGTVRSVYENNETSGEVKYTAIVFTIRHTSCVTYFGPMNWVTRDKCARYTLKIRDSHHRRKHGGSVELYLQQSAGRNTKFLD